jgi:hypothetical protein
VCRIFKDTGPRLQQPQLIIAQDGFEPAVRAGPQLGKFDRHRDFVRPGERQKDHQVQRSQRPLDPAQQLAGRGPFKPLGGAHHIEIGDEIEGAAIEDDLNLTGRRQDQRTAPFELLLQIATGRPVGERRPLLGQQPIGLRHGFIRWQRADKVLEQGCLARAVCARNGQSHLLNPSAPDLPIGPHSPIQGCLAVRSPSRTLRSA